MFGINNVSKRLDAIAAQNATIIQLLNGIAEKETKMSTQMDALVAQVAQTATVEQSAVVLIQGITSKLADLTQQLAAGGTDVTQLQNLTDQLKAATDPLAAAVTANTPASPAS
jgi:hypothetical protein